MSPRLRDYLLTIVSTVGSLCGLTIILYDAYHFFPNEKLAAIVGQIAIIVLIVYLIRWTRYPGLYQSKSTLRLTGEYLAAVFTFSGGLLIISLLAYFHVLWFVKLNNLGNWLGLEFKFKKDQMVKVSRAAPQEFAPGCVGRVVRMRVVQRDDFGQMHVAPIGTVYYTLQFADGMLEIPEGELVS